MAKPSDKNSNNAEEQIHITPDGDVGEALEKGMDALKSVFGGIVDMVQDTIGPDGMKNLGAAQWLTQVASSLEEAATGLRDGAVPSGKAGEISCFVDRLEDELKGSKFESQMSTLRDRLQKALQAIERVSGTESPISSGDVDMVADAAGYFTAAASSVTPAGGSENATS